MNTHISRTLAIITIILLLVIEHTYAAYNPTFDRSNRYINNVCQNSTNNISVFLAVTDNDTAQRIIWTLIQAPTHGTITGLSDTGSSTGGSIRPRSVLYTPATGYTSLDSIKVVVSDSIFTDTITMVFNVRNLPSISVSNSRINICALTDTALNAIGTSTATPLTYTWIPSTGLSATTGSNVTARLTSSVIYTVTVTDTFRCQRSAFDTINIRPLPNITASPSSLTICSGSDTTLSATGAVSYIWSPASSLSTSTGASVIARPISTSAITTSYIVYGTDSTNCTNSATVSVNINPVPNDIAVASGGWPITCIGHSRTLLASPSGGIWSIGSTSIATFIPAGDACDITGRDTGYTFMRYTLPTGCLTSLTIAVNPFSWILDRLYTCVGTPITVTGGITSSILGTHSGESVSSVGTIHVTNTYSGGCLLEYFVDVVPKPRGITGPRNICEGTSDTLRNAVSGGKWFSSNTAVATIDSNTGVTRARIPGTTTIFYRMPHGCDTSISLRVDALPTIRVNNTTVCVGNSINVTATGASTYVWSPTSTLSSSTGSSVLASPSTTTIYTVIGTDANRCINNTTFTVNVNSYPSPPTVAGSVTYCRGVSAAPLSASGSALRWYTTSAGGVGTSSLTPGTSTAGTITYYVSQTVGGCESVRDSIRVIILPLPSVSISVDSPSICIGRSAHLTAGGSSISYTWSPAATLNSSTAFNVIATPTTTTVYSLTGRDVNNCINTVFSTITVNRLPTLTTTPSAPEVCLGSSITVTAGGASTYVWSPASTLSSSAGTTVSMSPTVATTYTITGTDGNGCRASLNLSVTVNTLPIVAISPSNDSICFGDTITLSAIGALSYIWLASAGLLDTNIATARVRPSSSTSYTVIGQDINGCRDTAQANIHVLTLPTVNISSTDSICSGSLLTMTASGASFYTWSPASALNSSTAINVTSRLIASMTFTLIGRDVNNCINSVQKTIVVNRLPTITVTPVIDTICLGDTTLMIAAGGISYSWRPISTLLDTNISNVRANPSSNTVYTVIGTDINGCKDTTQASIIVRIPTPISILPSSDSICIGTNTTLTASGAITYTWMPSISLSSSVGTTITATPTVTTTYTVTGRDRNDCKSITQSTIVVNRLPILIATPFSPIVCLGGSLLDTVSGAATYVWSPASTLSSSTGAIVTMSPTVATTYTITGTDSNGCVNRLLLPVSINSSTSRPTVTSPVRYCQFASSSALTASGTALLWYTNRVGGTGSATAPIPSTSTVGATTYYVTQSSSTCESLRDSIVVIINSLPTITTTPSSPVVCLGGSLSVTAGGASTYVWSPASTLSSSTGTTVSMSPTVATTYTITGTDGNGCVNSLSVPVSINTSTSRPTVTGLIEYCQFATTAPLTAGGTSLRWYTNRTGGTGLTIAPTPSSAIVGSTTYYVTQSSSSCESLRDSIRVSILGLPTVSITPSLDTICLGDTSHLTATGAISYSWIRLTSLLDTNIVDVRAIPLGNTTYTVIGRDPNNCTDTAQASVMVRALPILNISLSTDSICIGSNSTLTASGATLYRWTPATALSSTTGISVVATPTITTRYTLIGTDIHGCINNVADTIIVDNIPALPTILNRTIHYCQFITPSALSSNVIGTNVFWHATHAAFGTSTIPTINTSIPGTYRFYVSQRPRICSSPIDSFIIIVDPQPNLNVTATRSTICIGDSTTLTTTGCNFYNWMPSTSVTNTGALATAFPYSTTIYTIIGTDSNLCNDTTTIRINVNNLPTLNITSSTSTICNGLPSSLNASGATTYTWQPASSISASTGSTVIASPSSTTTYTIVGTDANGCIDSTTKTINVNPIPSRPIVGSPLSYCQFQTATPLSATGDNIKWYTSTTSTGSTTPITPSTAVVDTQKYYVTQTQLGCESLFDSIVVYIKSLPTINCTPSNQSICIGNSASLTATGGISYSWFPRISISDTSAASISCTPSVTTIYTVIGTGLNSCKNTATSTVTVNPLPTLSVTASSDTVCTLVATSIRVIGARTYTWSPSGSLSASTGDSVIAHPPVTTTYTITAIDSNGCSNAISKAIHVNSYPSPPSISRLLSYCQSTTSDTLTAIGSNILWYNSSTTSIGSRSAPLPITTTVDTTFYYVTQTVSGCESNRDSIRVIILPLPNITTAATLNTICLTDSANLIARGGISYHWSPSHGLSSTTNDSVNASPSSTTIYTITGTGSNSCQNKAFDTVVVNSLPNDIEGASYLCLGTPVNLSSSTSGGVWTSGDTSIIRISTIGTALGVNTGTSTITYSIGTGCFTSFPLTVYPYPADIVGPTSICPNDTESYSNTTLGGTWSLSNTSIANIASDGRLFSFSPDIDTIIYRLSSGCFKTLHVTINPLPNDISGPSSICERDIRNYSNTSIGGTWSTDDTTIGIVNSSGNLTALTSGVVNLTYTMPTGCYKALRILVNPLPTAIIGADSVCPQSSVQYTNSIAGGNWSVINSNTVINSTGLLSALNAGLDTVVYTISTGCKRSLPIRINPLPSNIVGDSSLCVQSTTILNSATSGGTWSQYNTSIDSLSLGYILGKNAGIDTIFYTLPTGCRTQFTLTVLPLPYNIVGPDTVCHESRIRLTNSTLGGRWHNVDTTIILVNDSGFVLGVRPGIDSIFYILPTGCKKSYNVLVNPLPAMIIGRDSVCERGQITLTNTTTSGQWLSANPRALIDSSGIVTGILQGIDTITYILPTGCLRTKEILIQPLPSNILGADSLCSRATMSVFNATSGGRWSNLNPTISTINTSGLITGLRAGRDSIYYTLPTSCYVAKSITINPLPTPLFADSTSCIGNPLILRDTAGRSVFVVYPSTTGVVTITLATSSGCTSNVSSIIYPNPSPIDGNTGICLGTTSMLTDSILGGSWSIADSIIATINSSGLLYARSLGTTTVTYTLSTGCFVTKRVDVNSLFNFSSYSALYPTTCNGDNGSITLYGLGNSRTYRVDYFKDSIPMFSFKYADTSGRLIIDSLSAGSYRTIRVSLSGCTSNNIDTFLLDPLPPSRPRVLSNSPICQGDNLLLQAIDTTAAVTYLWTGPSSFISTLSNPTITGYRYADSGFYRIRVSRFNCHVYDSIYVTTLRIPSAGIIIGDSTLCRGTSITLIDSVVGGSWYASNGLATIDRTTGSIRAIRSGYDTIIYVVGNICGNDSAFKEIFINQIPPTNPIVGPAFVCVGDSQTYTNASSSGSWLMSNSNAIISSRGAVTGITGGVDTILFVVSNICGSDTSIKQIDIVPPPAVDPIIGSRNVCVNASITLTNTTLGGSWSTSNATIATITASGVVRGINAGTTIITYSYTNRCGTIFTTDTIQVLPLPNAGFIVGDSSICLADSSTLRSTIRGGAWYSLNPSIINIGRANSDSAIIQGSTSGFGQIRYIYTNTCGSDTTEKRIEVKAIPTLISTTNPTPICSGNMFNYIPQSSLLQTTYTWYRGINDSILNPSTSGIDSISENLINLSPLDVLVTYRISMISRGCQAFQNITIKIKPTPKLSSESAITRCSGIRINYQPQSNTPGTNFVWFRPTVAGINPLSDTGSGFIAEALTNTTSISIIVPYSLRLTAFGCYSDTILNVKIENQAPNAPKITTMCPPRVCQKTMYQNFGAETAPPPGTNYYWYAHSAQVWATGGDRQYCLVNFPDTAMFSWVVLASTYTGNICASKDSFAVLVDDHISEQPEVIYSYYLFICKWNTAASYQWGYDDRYTLDSSLLSGETNQAYLCSNPDFTHKLYWVITNYQGCRQKTYLKVPTWIKSPEELESENVLLYPNPNDGNFEIEIKSSYTEDANITISNALGIVVGKFETITNQTFKVNTNNLDGIYFVTITTNHGKIVKKIVIGR